MKSTITKAELEHIAEIANEELKAESKYKDMVNRLNRVSIEVIDDFSSFPKLGVKYPSLGTLDSNDLEQLINTLNLANEIADRNNRYNNLGERFNVR